MRPLWLFFSYAVISSFRVHQADIPVMSVHWNYTTTLSDNRKEVLYKEFCLNYPGKEVGEHSQGVGYCSAGYCHHILLSQGTLTLK